MTRTEIIKKVDWGGWTRAFLPMVIALIAFITMLNRIQFTAAANSETLQKHTAIIEVLQHSLGEIRTSQAVTIQRLDGIQKSLDKLESK